MEEHEKEEIFFGRGAPAIDLEITKALDSRIYDTQGESYIDFLGGAGVGILGWGNRNIETAIRRSDRPSYVYPNFSYQPWINLAEQIASITPEHLKKVYRTTGGSEAVEAAMQMAMMYTKRKKFLSIEGSYHGNTLGTLSLGASANKEKFPGLLPGCEKIELPLDQKALEKIESHLSNNEIAAFFMEPVLTNLGVIIPEKEFMSELGGLCKKYGTLLVMDEVVTGFGRTGHFFATEDYEIKPDIMCLAKGMSAGHAGIGACLTTKEIAKEIEGKIGLYSTYGWHPIGVSAALATIKQLLLHREAIFKNIGEVSKIFEERLNKIDFREKAEIRVKGLAIGVDVKDKKYASQLKEKSLQAGLLLNTEGSNLIFLPALNIEKDLVQEGLDILEDQT